MGTRLRPPSMSNPAPGLLLFHRSRRRLSAVHGVEPAVWHPAGKPARRASSLDLAGLGVDSTQMYESGVFPQCEGTEKPSSPWEILESRGQGVCRGRSASLFPQTYPPPHCKFYMRLVSGG